MKASKSLLIFLLGTSIINESSAQTLINPDGVSTSDSLPTNSLSVSIGASNSTSVGNWGNGAAGGNLLLGSGNFANVSDSSFSGGLGSNLSNQEGTLVFGFYNDVLFPSGTQGQSNIVLGYGNVVHPNPAYGMTWGAIVLGDSNESQAEDSWVIGRGNIGQTETLTVGTHALPVSNASFIVGNGTSINTRANGLVVFRDGSTLFGGDLKVSSNKGIYFGTNTSPTISSTANGTAIFPRGISATGGLTLSGGNLSISTGTTSTSSTTGAFVVTGGIGVSADSWINGVRVGRGSGNIATNVVLGGGSLQSNTAGANNTSVGLNATYFNTTGGNNSAFGSHALHKNTTGSNNSSFGNESARNTTTGSFNSSSGAHSLYFNTTGSYNTAIGQGAMQLNTTGSNNTATGHASLQLNTTGANNSALGQLALYGNKSGNSNVAIGFSSGKSTTGNGWLESPDNSVYIGANATGLNDNDNNSIVIGANAIGQGANTTVIGNSNTTSTRLFGELTVGSGAGEVVLTPSSAIGFGFITNSNLWSSVSYELLLNSVALSNGSAVGPISTAMSGGIASGVGSTAMGASSAYGDLSLATGATEVSSYNAAAFGRFNENRNGSGYSYFWDGTSQDSVFEVGIGSDSENRANALTILQDGTVEIGKDATDGSIPLQVKSDGTVMLAKPQGDISMGIYQ